MHGRIDIFVKPNRNYIYSASTRSMNVGPGLGRVNQDGVTASFGDYGWITFGSKRRSLGNLPKKSFIMSTMRNFSEAD